MNMMIMKYSSEKKTLISVRLVLLLLCFVLLCGCTPRGQIVQEPLTRSVTVGDFEIVLSAGETPEYTVEIRYLGSEGSVKLEHGEGLFRLYPEPRPKDWKFGYPETLYFSELRAGESLSFTDSLPSGYEFPVGEYTLRVEVEFRVSDSREKIAHTFEVPLTVTKKK